MTTNTINSHHEFPFSVYGLEHGLSEVGQRRLLGGHPEPGGKVRKHCDPGNEHRGSFQQHHQPTNILHLKKRSQYIVSATPSIVARIEGFTVKCCSSS